MSIRPPLSADLPAQALGLLSRAQERRTVHEGRQTVWHVWGRGDPLVMFHGGSGSWTHWIRNVDALVAAGRELWIPDLPGFGDSDVPAGGNDADAMVEPMFCALAELLEGRAFDLVAFSMGGLVAGLVAVRQPVGLRRLVITGSPIIPVGVPPVRLLDWRHLPDKPARDAVHRANLLSLMLHRGDDLTQDTLDLHAANVDRDRLRGRRLAQSGALGEVLKQLPCPLATIYGLEDALFKGRFDMLRATLAAAPTLASSAYLPGVGHWAPFEAPEAFHRELLAALRLPLPA